MESLSSVNTILRIAQDLKAALAVVDKNDIHYQKLAERVQGISDLLQHLEKVSPGKKMDAATQRLLDRLQKTLSESLGLVRSWQSSRCPYNFFIGGRMAERLDEVDRDINRCLHDLNVSKLIRIARLEKQLHHHNDNIERRIACLETQLRHHNDNIERRIACLEKQLHHHNDNIERRIACLVEMQLRHSAGGSYAHNAAGPSHTASAYNYNHYSQYSYMFSGENPDEVPGTGTHPVHAQRQFNPYRVHLNDYSPYLHIFSDENPNACSVM